MKDGFKKIICILLVFILSGSCYSMNALSPDQKSLLQKQSNNVITCMYQEAIPFLGKGHTPSYSVAQSLKVCKEDSVAIIVTFMSFGATEPEIKQYFDMAYSRVVVSIDKQINESIEKSEQQAPKEEDLLKDLLDKGTKVYM